MEKEYLKDLFIVLQMALNGEIILNFFNQQGKFQNHFRRSNVEFF